MANLPTAYASQRFGRKTLDFYAVEGDVIGADPRARSEERRLEDFDGQRHTVRLMEKGFQLEPGQTATVLRMQPGPGRRSRPVAVVNHDTETWCRTHPGAEGLLAKAGVARTLNWALTMVLFALTALALVWPFLRAFMVEVDPGLFGAAPVFNIAELAVAALPSLASWSFSELVAPLTGPLTAALPTLAPFADMLVFGTGVLVAVLGVYLLRSWRLLWAPLFVGGLGAVSIGYGGVSGMVEPALLGLGLATLLFTIGGLINRIRDGARLEARIAVLSDHLLRQGPQDAVVAPEVDAEFEAEEPAHDDVDPVVPLAAATAATLREPFDGEAEEAVDEIDPDTNVEESATTEALEADEVGEAIDAVEAEEAGDASGIDDEATAAVETGTTVEGVAEGVVDAEAAPEVTEGEAPADALTDEAVVVEPEPEDMVEAASEAETAPVEPNEDVAPEDQEEAVDALAEPVANQVAESDAADDPADAAVPEPVENLETQTTEHPTPDQNAAPAGLDPEEAERLRTDPRYASRAIVLPPPPPMPTPGADLGEGSGEAVGQGTATTLRPSAPLPDNVIPIFAAPAAAETSPDSDAPTDADPA